jgi:hypothetical protein
MLELHHDSSEKIAEVETAALFKAEILANPGGILNEHDHGIK